MTIGSDNTLLVEYAGDGSQQSWPVHFSYLDSQDLTLKIKDENKNVTTLKYGLDYSVYPKFGVNGGEVHTTLPIHQNSILMISLDPIISQEMDLRNNGVLDAEALESALDKLTLIAKTLKAKIVSLEAFTVTVDSHSDELIEFDARLNSEHLAIDAVNTKLTAEQYKVKGLDQRLTSQEGKLVVLNGELKGCVTENSNTKNRVAEYKVEVNLLMKQINSLNKLIESLSVPLKVGTEAGEIPELDLAKLLMQSAQALSLGEENTEKLKVSLECLKKLEQILEVKLLNIDDTAAEDTEIENLRQKLREQVAKTEQWADNPEDSEVEAGKYSAKHWAQKANIAKESCDLATAEVIELGTKIAKSSSVSRHAVLSSRQDETGQLNAIEKGETPFSVTLFASPEHPFEASIANGEEDYNIHLESSLTLDNLAPNATTKLLLEYNPETGEKFLSKTLFTPTVGFIKHGSAQGLRIENFEPQNGFNSLSDTETMNASPPLLTNQTPAKFGEYCLSRSSCNGFYIIPVKFDLKEAWTLEFWFKATGTGTIAALGTNYTDRSLQLNLNSSNQIHYYQSTTGNASWNIVNNAGSNVVQQNAWNHFAMVFSGTNYTAYLNGKQDNNLANPNALGGQATKIFLGSAETVSLRSYDAVRLVQRAVYLGQFTPPTAPFSYDLDSKIHWFDLSTKTARSFIDNRALSLIPVGEITTNASGITNIICYSKPSVQRICVPFQTNTTIKIPHTLGYPPKIEAYAEHAGGKINSNLTYYFYGTHYGAVFFGDDKEVRVCMLSLPVLIAQEPALTGFVVKFERGW